MTQAERSGGLPAQWLFLTATLLLLPATNAPAQAPLGSEFQVNTYTTGNQQRGAITATPSGEFVVAWSSNGSSGSDTSYYSVQARRFDAAGMPLGDQFQVNTYTTRFQTYPAVASDMIGNFVVVWESEESNDSIQGQRYDSAGMALGSQFQVNTNSATFRPSVAMSASGDFVVVWTGGSFGAGSEGARVLGQRFDSAGGPVGGEFQVNTLTTDNQWFPAVTTLPGGGFLVVFGSAVSAGSDTDDYSVQARFYDANGVPLGAEFQVNTYTTTGQTFPEVSVDATGDFVVVWHVTGLSTDINTTEVRARRFAAGGTSLGDDFQVNTYTSGRQEFPEVAVDPSGGFAIVWETVSVAHPVQARRYDAAGTPQGDEIQASVSLNTGRPHVAMDGLGRFIVAGEVFPGGLGGSEIFGLRFAAPPGPIPVKIAVIKPGKLFKFVAKGEFPLPDPAVDNPTVEGGELSFIGAFGGGQTYALPPACWKALGPGGDGSKGFKCKDTACIVIVKEKVIKGVCKPDTGTFMVPEAGPVAIQLRVGTGTTRYCGQCGGTPKGDPDKLFKHKDCAAPLLCP